MDTTLDTIQRTGGLIHRFRMAADVEAGAGGATIIAEIGLDNPLVELARQFGEAMGNRKALRSALGTRPNSRALAHTDEPHERGAILVAAVFDAFFSIYIRRTRDLIRMTYPDGALPKPNFLNADLAERLASEAARTADRILTICIRALDYCPPVDIEFGDFLRALVTADADVAPEDGGGYRASLVEAFRLRGIRPRDLRAWSESQLCWPRVDPALVPPDVAENLRRLWVDLARCESADEPGEQRAKLGEIYYQLWNKADRLQQVLQLDPGAEIHVTGYQTVERVRPNGSIERRISTQIHQKNTADGIENHGGTTMLFNRDGELLYAIAKPLADPDRRKRQCDYLENFSARHPLSAFTEIDARKELHFQSVHRGY